MERQPHMPRTAIDTEASLAALVDRQMTAISRLLIQQRALLDAIIAVPIRKEEAPELAYLRSVALAVTSSGGGVHE